MCRLVYYVTMLRKYQKRFCLWTVWQEFRNLSLHLESGSKAPCVPVDSGWGFKDAVSCIIFCHSMRTQNWVNWKLDYVL